MEKKHYRILPDAYMRAEFDGYREQIGVEVPHEFAHPPQTIALQFGDGRVLTFSPKQLVQLGEVTGNE